MGLSTLYGKITNEKFFKIAFLICFILVVSRFCTIMNFYSSFLVVIVSAPYSVPALLI